MARKEFKNSQFDEKKTATFQPLFFIKKKKVT